jgi:polyisoprenoid-binding protein YceI
MTAAKTPQAVSSNPTRKRRHWVRWALVSVAALVVVIVAVTVLAIRAQTAPAPLALPSTAAPPLGPVDGTWQATTGSVAGFRVQQTVLGMTADVVGRTTDVTGTVVISGGQVTSASLTIKLLSLTSGRRPVAPQFAISLDTAEHSNATAQLTEPVPLAEGFAAGAVTNVSASGQLTLRGVTRSITAALAVRRDAARIRVAGSVPIAFANYGLDRPKGYGAFGSLADHGTAEFLLVLRQS